MSTEDDKKKLTKEQALAAMLDDFTLEHHAEEAKAMTKDELLADRDEQGLPKERVDALFAKQDAMIREAQEADAKKPAPPKLAEVIPLRRQGLGLFVGSGLAATFAAAAAIALFVSGTIAYQGSGPVSTGAGTGTSTIAEADAIRDEAWKECGKTHWQKCLDLFDKARRLDDPGDYQPEVQTARRLAVQMLAAKDGGR